MEFNFLITVEQFVRNSGDENFEFSLAHGQSFGALCFYIDMAFNALSEALLNNSGLYLKITMSDKTKNLLHLECFRCFEKLFDRLITQVKTVAAFNVVHVLVAPDYTAFNFFIVWNDALLQEFTNGFG